MRIEGEKQSNWNFSSKAFALFISKFREIDNEKYHEILKEIKKELSEKEYVEWYKVFCKKLSRFHRQITGESFRKPKILPPP